MRRHETSRNFPWQGKLLDTEGTPAMHTARRRNRSWLDRTIDGEPVWVRILCALGVALLTLAMCLLWAGSMPERVTPREPAQVQT